MRRKKSLAEQDKTYAQREHFKNRARERYGLEVNRHLYREMVDLIQRNKAVLIERQSTRITVWWLYLEGEHTGKKLRVVYDGNRGTLVTALPPDGPITFDKEELL